MSSRMDFYCTLRDFFFAQSCPTVQHCLILTLAPFYGTSPGTEAFETGQRFCIDGAALVFYPNDGGDPLRGDIPKAKEVPSWLEPPEIKPNEKA